jgi:hypothetical protein
VQSLTTNGTIYPPNVYATCNKPTLRFDTYITLGSATSRSGISLMGSLSLASSVIEENTGWFKTGGVHVTGDGIDEYVTFSSEE